MKKGFFKSRSLLLLTAILWLPGCASFLQFGDHGNGEDPAEFDRGYDELADADSDHTETIAKHQEEDTSASDTMDYSQRRVKRAISSRDVVIGMTRREVSESWGRPTQREVAGRGDGGHERWTYGSRFSLNGSRTVIFENGRVAGWNQ